MINIDSQISSINTAINNLLLELKGLSDDVLEYKSQRQKFDEELKKLIAVKDDVIKTESLTKNIFNENTKLLSQIETQKKEVSYKIKVLEGDMKKYEDLKQEVLVKSDALKVTQEERTQLEGEKIRLKQKEASLIEREALLEKEKTVSSEKFKILELKDKQLVQERERLQRLSQSIGIS